ncbi:MAG TPA: FecR domain-containing protein [Allosphingosinicella sp.]|nr:FecR domain-containing protein [Allosphingosinicella sp.]
MTWPFRSRADRLDDEAAEWLARMRGPDRERHRDAFEAWRRTSPAHAEAYDEASAIFEASSVLRQGELAKGRELPRAAGRGWRVGYALAAAVVLVALLSAVFLSGAHTFAPGRSDRWSAQYATSAGETRQIELPDGSHMTLWGGSAANVAFDDAERRITLTSGHGRFAVAHEERPFRVAAGRAEVVAHGTLFDVSLSGGRARVELIEGSVDVSYPAPRPGNSERRVRRLQPGQQIVVGEVPQPQAALGSAAQVRAAPAMLQFDETPLADAVAESNRRGGPTIRLADPSIGALRVTGAFRAGDANGLAEALAAAFHLRIERLPYGTLVLHSEARPPAP